MNAKRNAPQCYSTNGAKREYVQRYYNSKKRLSKAQRAILHDLFGALLMFASMVGMTILLLLVGG